jgi:hypothetical protein
MKGRFSVFRVSLTLVALGTIGACLPDAHVNRGTGGTSGSGGSGGVNGMVSCGGASGTSALATWANVRSIIEPDSAQPGGCFGADCHRQGEREPVMVGTISDPLSDTDLYNKLTTYRTSAKCGNRVLVKPCAPDDSAFYRAQAGTCGELPQMPFGCLPEFENCTPADKLEGLRQWIANGAPRP